MSNSIYTPLISLRTPLLITPQNKLFTPHSFKQHSHPTLHIPHNPASIWFVPPKPILPVFLPKNHPRTPNPEIQQEPSLQPPSSAPNPILPLLPKTHPTTPKSGDSTKISSKFAFCCVYSCIFTVKYQEI